MHNLLLLCSLLLVTLPQTRAFNPVPDLAHTTQLAILEKREYPVITVSVPQPTTCSALVLSSYSQQTAIPTGQVQIQRDDTIEAGWGRPGSIWNFTLDDGVKWQQLSATCQGSACTSGGGTERDGQILKPSDSIWQLNVTDGMAPSIDLMGVTEGGQPVDGNFHLTITATPACALPIAQNCSNSNFDPSTQQWDAWSVDKWLANYTEHFNLEDMEELFTQLTNDFLSDTQREVLLCSPDNPDYSCQPPAGTDLEEACDNTEAQHGLLVLWGIIRLSNVLHLLHETFRFVQEDVLAWVGTLVDTFVKPTVQQKWEAIVAAASSIIGILIFLFIIADALTEGASTGVAVGVIVGVTNTIGAAAAFGNGFDSQKPDDTYLKMVGSYDDGVKKYGQYMQNSSVALWKPEDPSQFNSTSIQNLLRDGHWTDVANPLNIDGLGTTLQNFFDVLLLTSLINMSWKNDNFFIVFLPYDTDVTDFETQKNHNPDITQFTHDNCTQHWANDPKRIDYISCDLNYGGQAGMTVLAMPSTEAGTGTYTLVKDVSFTEDQVHYTFSTEHVLQSSLSANALYGYNYNLTTDQMNSLVQDGAASIANDFAQLPPDTPGLYNLDVCVVTKMSEVPGAGQYGSSNARGASSVFFYPDPCSCAGFETRGQRFVDFAKESVVKGVTVIEADGFNNSCVDRREDSI